MKIKRIAAALTAAVIALSLTACGEGDKHNDSKDESSDISESSAEESTPESDKTESETVKEFGMWDVLPEIPVTEVSAFGYRLNDDGDGIIITDFLTDETKIRIPDRIDGKPVVALRLNEDISPLTYIDDPEVHDFDDVPEYKKYDITELILPDTVEEIFSPVLMYSYSPNAPALEKVEYMNYPAKLCGCYCVFPSLKCLYIDEGTEVFGKLFGHYFTTPKSLKTLYIPSDIKAFGQDSLTYYENGETRPIDVETIYYKGNTYSEYTDELDHLINDVNGDGFGFYPSPDGKKTTLYGFYSSRDTVVIPDGTQAVNSICFRGSESLKKIVIPASVSRFYSDIDDDYCCNGCPALETVTIKEGTQIITLRGFNNCTSLKSIVIPDGPIHIENSFENCTSLTSVTIPDSVIKIYNSFVGCTNISEITLGDNVSKDIDWSEVFAACKNNSDLKIRYKGAEYSDFAQLKDAMDGKDMSYIKTGFKIEDGVLVEYTGEAEDVIVPDTVNAIGNNAFSNCDYLKSVVVPDCVKTIGTNAFCDCPKLMSVTLPDNIELNQTVFIHDVASHLSFSESMAFYGSENVKVKYRNKIYDYDSLGKLRKIIKYRSCLTDDNTKLVIPKGTTSIEQCQYYGCNFVDEIIIPDGVEYIGCHAFSECSGITSIRIPDGVKMIGCSAFSGCTGLKHITLPDSVTQLGDYSIGFGSYLTSGFNCDVTYKGVTYSKDDLEALYEAVNGEDYKTRYN